MRRDLKTYVWQKDIERRKKDRRKKVVNGIIIEDYDRRKEEKKIVSIMARKDVMARIEEVEKIEG